jgi:hypothetical protein
VQNLTRVSATEKLQRLSHDPSS